MGPLLSVIIVNWNSRRYLEQCLDALRFGLQGISSELIVVDNASSDHSAVLVRERYPDVLLLANKENRGFAAGVNMGLKVSRGRFVLVLNPDILVRPATVHVLLEYLDLHPQVGCIMPRFLNSDGTPQKGYVRRIPTVLQVVFFHTVLEPWSRRRDFLVASVLEAPVMPAGGAHPVDQIPGAFMLVRRSVVDSVGFMDEEYGLFYEDVDWSDRMRNGGWSLVLDEDVAVCHAGGGSFERANHAWLAARMALSLLLFFGKRKTRGERHLVRVILLANAVFAGSVRSFQLLLAPASRRRDLRASRERHVAFLRLYREKFWKHRQPALQVEVQPDGRPDA